jgi:peptide chain release factor 1
VRDEVLAILKKNKALTLALPRCAWGYLLRVSEVSEALTKDNAIFFKNSNSGSEKESSAVVPVTSDELIDIKKKFRRELELLEGSRFGETLRQIRDASELMREGVASKDESLVALAAEDIDRLSAPEHFAECSAMVEVAEVIGQVVEASDELTTIADKWTLETLGRAGGEEAAIFARELKEMYVNYCQNVRGWSVEDISEPEGQGGKIRISGPGIYTFLRHEIGVHRVQRVPTTEASGRLQTSTASVFLLPQPSRVSVDINPSDVEIEMVRGSGPGGQGVNSSSNCCRLVHKPSGICIRTHQARSGNANRELAMDLLAQKLWERKFKESKRAHDDIFSSQWTSGERGERMRTYNFPQNRITDHRYDWNCNTAARFMSGVGPLEELHELAVKISRERSMRTVLDELNMKLPRI